MSSLVDLKHFAEDNDIMGKTVTREISCEFILETHNTMGKFQVTVRSRSNQSPNLRFRVPFLPIRDNMTPKPYHWGFLP